MNSVLNRTQKAAIETYTAETVDTPAMRDSWGDIKQSVPNELTVDTAMFDEGK